MPSKRRIGILTGGGDVPGLNVAIKAVVTRAQNHDTDKLVNLALDGKELD